MTGQVIFTPFDLSDAQPAGKRRFWKQVLPDTTINYKGQRIRFDKNYHMDLADAFASKAFDQVPVVFADGSNAHNMDPRNFGGDVLNMETRKDGLYALIEADEDAAKAIERNPKLGVSARIRQMVEKADGRKFGKAVEHLCLTMNPRVTGMGPWQAVDLSDEDTDHEVVDLTAATFEEGTTVGKSATKTRTRRPASSKRRKDETPTIDLSLLDDDEFQALLDLAEAEVLEREGTDEDDDDLEDKDLEVETPERRKVRRKKSRKKVTIETDDEADDPDDGDDPEVDDEDLQDLSDADRTAGREALSHVQQMRIDLAESRWETERGNYLREGVPAFLLDLAEPVLSLPDAVTIDLADGDEPLDATATIREMLDGVKGIVDLTGEIGHQIDLTDDDTSDEADAFLAEWDKNYG